MNLLFKLSTDARKKISLGSAAAFAGINAIGQERANQSNEKIAAENRKFQRQMSNTAYRRAVRDMRLAGLNPMLAGINSSPASTPGGSTAVMRNVASGAIASGMQAMRLGQELDNMEATEGNTVTDTEVKKKTIEKLDADIDKTKAETAESASRTEGNLNKNEITGAGSQIPAVINDAIDDITKEGQTLYTTGKEVATDKLRKAKVVGKSYAKKLKKWWRGLSGHGSAKGN